MGSITPTIQKSLSPTPKINYGHRLLPHVIDELASTHPNHIVNKTALSTNISDGFNPLTALELAQAINYLSHHITNLLETSPSNPIPIAYIGPQDPLYIAIEIACMKTSHPLLIPSTRNALSNSISLLQNTGIRNLFYTSSPSSDAIKTQALALQSHLPGLRIHALPTLAEIISRIKEGKGEEVQPYPYTKTFEEAKDEVVLMVHTSGSTGVPKPISYTHKWLNRIDSDVLIPGVEGRVKSDMTLMRSGTKQFAATPYFHLSGITIGFLALFRAFTAVMGPPHQVVDAGFVADVVRREGVTGLVLVPSLCDAFVEEWGEDLREEESLRCLEHVVWLGGPLAKATGDWITTNTNATLWQIYGSTEMSCIPMLVPSRSRWQFFEFHPTFGPTLERIYPESDLHELVIHRHPDPSLAWTQPVFYLFPELQEWRSRDLFKRSTERGCEDLWMYQGRVDDMMVMHNGLKVNPLHIEMKLFVHSALKGCLVFGTGYTKCGILLEPKNPEVKGEELVEVVWPSIEEANATVPEHARVQKGLILVGKKDRPFARAAKGTIIRSLTVGLYRDEIQTLYGGQPMLKNGIHM